MKKKVISLRKKRSRRRTGLSLIAIIVLFVCGIVSYKRQELNNTNAEAAAKIEELKGEITVAKDDAKDIKEMKTYVHTLKFIEEMAREKLGLVYKDEIIFKSED
jgi:cell division protein DivIC